MMRKPILTLAGMLASVALTCFGVAMASSHDDAPPAPGQVQADRPDRLPAEGAPLSPAEEVYFLQRQTDGNAMGLVVSNYGFLGNNFVTRSPSMEYPLGSQIEHLIRAGLWIGGINTVGDTVVSSGSVSGTWGGSGAGVTEFNPMGKIKERSTLISSRALRPNAVSEQDFVAHYRDYNPIRPANRGKALRVSVDQRSYLWSYRFAEAFVIVSFTIRYEGDGTLSDLRLGIFSELSSGWKGAYDTWRPPSGSWFRKKALEYFEDERMIGEHHYTYQDGTAPSWGAIALLGTTGIVHGDSVPSIDQVPVSFNWWDWHSEADSPGVYTDPYRFRLMGNGAIGDWKTVRPETDDPVELVSAGPFPITMVSGDSIVFVCAFLGGMDRESLIKNAQWAQRAFNNNYILPSPPQPPRFRVKPTKGAIDLYWDNYPEDKLDPFYQTPDFEGYRIFITRKAGATSEDFELVRDLDLIDGLGYDTGFESVRDTTYFGDTLYTYHIQISDLKDGFRYWASVGAYDKGVPEQGVESMQSGVLATKVLTVPGPSAEEDGAVSVFPNPYRGEAVWDGARDREKYVWFVNLPKRATIRIYTLAGDLVRTLEFDADTYTAVDVQGLKTKGERTVAMPGGMCAWDLISERDQAVATGLYIFSVENRESGKTQLGKLMIIR